MKKLFAVILAAALMLTLSVVAYAAERVLEAEIPLDADHVGQSSTGGAETVTIGDNSITANEIALFDLILPEKVALGETVVVHIKGTSDGDFRVWLLADGKTDEKGVEITFSNQWKGSENGFMAPGEFEKYIELTAEDYDGQNMTEADRVAFKGPSFGTNLANLTLNYVGIIKGSVADVEAGAVAELQPLADKAKAAAENIKNNADAAKADIEAALAEAQTALDELEAKNTLGFPGVADLVKTAKDSVKEIEAALEGAGAEEAVAAVQTSVDAVNTALADAKAAGEDIEKLEAALTAAKTAADEVAKSAEETGYKEVKALADSASESVKEIEKLLTAAKDAKALAEAEAAKAAEEAAAKKKTTTIIIVAVVAVVIIIAVVVAIISKKKKK